MNKFDPNVMKSGKEIYEKIEIPAELNDIVNRTIQSVDKKKIMKKNHQQIIIRSIKIAGGIAAALLVTTTIGLNTNQAFAEALSDVPIIGTLSKVLTIRSYEEQEENTTLSVKIPEIQEVEGTEDEKEFVTDINAEINQIVNEYISNAKADMEEYKKAFLETGGTEEEWNERPIDIQVTYDVKYQVGPYLSLVLYNSESWAAYTEERVYYNLDLEHDKELTLQDVLGTDYIDIANASIREQIEYRIENDGAIYWGWNSSDDTKDIEGFITVDENTTFYINADGNPVVIFPKYEIGPGYIGIQEFEIEGSILNTITE